MKPSALFITSVLLAVAPACGGGGDGGDDGPACPSGDCGQATFRRAVPTADRLRIGKPTGAAARTLPHLDPISDRLVAVEDEVDDINGMIDDVFDDLDDAVSTTPELQNDSEHVWRYGLADAPGLDEVLRITTEDGAHFVIEDAIGPAGFGPGEVAPVLYGEVQIDDDDATDFHLTIDLDALTAAIPEVDAQGDIVLAVMPLADGEDEIWFDFDEVAFGDDPVESSRTTAWVWADDSIGLEYVADREGDWVTVYARWDAEGGRYDHHLAWDDPVAGPVDEVATNCWSADAAEIFDAWAVVDAADSYYGELDGDEASCDFGPLADHPGPGPEFDDLPGDGEWTALELGNICDLIPCA